MARLSSPPSLVRVGVVATPGSDWSHASQASSNSVMSSTREERSVRETLRNELSAARVEANRARIERDILSAQMRRRGNEELAPDVAGRRAAAAVARTWRLAARSTAQDREIGELNEDLVHCLFLQTSLRRDLGAAHAARADAERRIDALERGATRSKQRSREADALGQRFDEEQARSRELASALTERDSALRIAQDRVRRANKMLNDLQRQLDTQTREERPHGNIADQYEAQLREMRRQLEAAQGSAAQAQAEAQAAAAAEVHAEALFGAEGGRGGDAPADWEARTKAAVVEARDEARRAHLDEWEACEAEREERVAVRDAERAAAIAAIVAAAAASVAAADADVARCCASAAAPTAGAGAGADDASVVGSLRAELAALRACAAEERDAHRAAVAATAVELAAVRTAAAATPEDDSSALSEVQTQLARAVASVNMVRDAAAREVEELRATHAVELAAARDDARVGAATAAASALALAEASSSEREREREQQSGYEAILDAAAVAAATVLMDEMEARQQGRRSQPATPERNVRRS